MGCLLADLFRNCGTGWCLNSLVARATTRWPIKTIEEWSTEGKGVLRLSFCPWPYPWPAKQLVARGDGMPMREHCSLAEFVASIDTMDGVRVSLVVTRTYLMQGLESCPPLRLLRQPVPSRWRRLKRATCERGRWLDRCIGGTTGLLSWLEGWPEQLASEQKIPAFPRPASSVDRPGRIPIIHHAHCWPVQVMQHARPFLRCPTRADDRVFVDKRRPWRVEPENEPSPSGIRLPTIHDGIQVEAKRP